MKIETCNETVSLTSLDSFNVAEILECGQCFRFQKNSPGCYKIIAFGKQLEIKEESGAIILSPCTEEEFHTIWYNYFDLSRDYSKIKEEISEGDFSMEAAIAHAPGIRVLNQEFWESCISFIISQNNRIPMIKKVIENICQKYGSPIEGGYAFPNSNQMSQATISELMELKTGFRAKYIVDAVSKSLNGHLDPAALKKLSEKDVRKTLVSVYGIGNKVSDCIMLFSLEMTSVFPADVWIKRVISELYYNGAEISLAELQAFAAHKWGENAGIAQQYLFHYARMNKIGV